MTCTFFGHRDAPEKIEPILRSTLVDLIENKNVDMFYVGNQGRFDHMVRSNLKYLKSYYPNIDYAVVFAYRPIKKDEFEYKDYSDTVYPEGLENTPPRFAISRRNIWMIDRSDYVVTYVNRIVGGAAHFKELSAKRGKTVLNLAEFLLT